MMDLHCCETTENEITACDDKTLHHERVLENMIKNEDRYVPMYSSSANIQTEITDPMIMIVGEWMMEVCEEQKCQDDVFLLAMNYMYRFLKTTNIKKNQLQLLGAACMFLASKLREPKPLPADTLVFYTDHSITKNMLMKWELLVLSKLKWDVVAIVPVDFLPHLLMRLNLERFEIRREMVKKHAKILITLCAKGKSAAVGLDGLDGRGPETKRTVALKVPGTVDCSQPNQCRFTSYHPSLIACACIVSALCGLGWVNKYQQTLDGLLRRLAELIAVETEIMRVLVTQIDEMIKENFNDVKDNKNVCEEVTRSEQCTPPPGKIRDHKTANTPTDVHDIYF
ncbi:G1/S-specific cyclin-D1 [Asbolus verrucosus]|uniref:G1/S-specific cyclin-D1 n=1 Tax=Asbolus verrucosus TaxID=1661398 RepID=A0A482VLN3_ASBVE|nr:G1/S-specific cyclin-D1 [Asbolus verrucosus]